MRRREVTNASDLLRMVLAYAVCDWSFRVVGAWCSLRGLGSVSDVAVRKRVAGCQRWLGVLIAALLQAHLTEWRRQPGVRVRLMDATCVGRPGSQGTDWRIHLSLDLGMMCMDGIEVSDSHRGETFARYPTQPGDIRVGDRGYGYASSLAPVLAVQGLLVVRINWQNLPLETPQGQSLSIISCLHAMSPLAPLMEYPVVLATDEGRFPLRLIIATLPQEVAECARHRLRKQARKKGKTPSVQTLVAAGFVLLLTNLPAQDWPDQQVLGLYRFRWQIELFFKRLKSLFHLDHLRAQTPPLAQVYLLGKLLGALLMDDCLQHARRLCPTWFSAGQPVSLWRLAHLFFEGLRSAVRGPICLSMILDVLPNLTRFLCGPPRKRPHQFAQAQALLASLLQAS